MVQGVVVQRPDWVGLKVIWRWGTILIIHGFVKFGNGEETNRKVTWVERTVLFPFFLRWRRINDLLMCKGIESLKILDPESNWWSKTPKMLEETGLKVQLKFKFTKKVLLLFQQQRDTEKKFAGRKAKENRMHFYVVVSSFWWNRRLDDCWK